MNKLVALFLVSAAGILPLAAAPLAVPSLSTVLSDVARNVGGDRVEVVEIVKAGVDPHLFEPTPGDVAKVSKAAIVLASGLGFESYLEKLRTAVGNGPVFFVAGDSVRPMTLEESACDEHHDHHNHHGGPTADPHWWHSVANVQAVASAMAAAFAKADPAGRDVYLANAAAFNKRLAELAKWSRLQIAALPKNKRVLVTSHDALGYFARDYGFEIEAVQGISTSDQPSSQKVRELIDRIRQRGVKAVFAENIENPKVLEQITQETGAKTGGRLYADGLGTGDAGTYEGMIRHNVTTIVAALK